MAQNRKPKKVEQTAEQTKPGRKKKTESAPVQETGGGSSGAN